MSLWGKLKAYGQIFRNRNSDRGFDQVALLRKSPGLMLAVNAMEMGQFVSSRVDPRLKTLALVKTSALVGCPF